MTAFASNILAALSGVGAKPGAGGVGAPEGVAGAFESMLAALIANGAVSAQGAAGEKSGSNLLTAETGKDADQTPQDQGAVEALLAAMLPVAAPAAPTPTVAAPDVETTPVAKAAVSAIAFAVDAAVDAALPAPAEIAVDAVATMLAEVISKEAPVTTDAVAKEAVVAPTATPAATKSAGLAAPVVQTAEQAAPAASAAPSPKAVAAAADPVFVARPDLPSLNGDKVRTDRAPLAPIDPKAPAPVADATTPPAAPVSVAPRGETVPAPTVTEASTAPQAPAQTAEAAAPVSDTAKAVQQAVTTMAAVSTPAVEAKPAAAPVAAAPAAATPVAAAAPQSPVQAEAPVVVTPAAIAQAAIEPQALPAETAQAIAATIAPATAKPAVAPTDTRRSVKTADVRTNLEADPVGPRSEKVAAKVAEAQSSVAEAALDAAPDAPLAAPVELAEADVAPQATAEGVTAEPAVAAATARHAEAAPVVRGSPETVQKLAADIVQKLNGQNSKFDLQLDPHGLGKVDVSVEINADGRLTAALSFDSAAAAADLKGRSAELRQMLQQAGFDVSDSSLSFDMAGQNPGFGGREAAGDQSRGQWSGRAFQTAQAGLDDADARLTAALSNSSRTPSGGVDIRI